MHLEENVSLAPLTTLRIGGPARFFARITSEPVLLEAVHLAHDRELPIFILGGGSNVVIADSGFPGLVIHIELPPSIVRREAHDAVPFDVSGGTGWDDLVLAVCRLGLSGMECLAGIPGLVGASPIQNIGAYGQEVSQTIESVRALDLATLTFVQLSREECRFGYRTSLFNSTDRNRYIVTSVRFTLSPSTKPNLSYADLAPLRGTDPTAIDVYHAVRAIRDRKGMLIERSNTEPHSRSAGSFFKNPIVPASSLASVAEALSIPTASVPHWAAPSGSIKLPAAWLIEQAGFPKGFALSREDPVAISSRHTLALINRSGTASCADLLRLSQHIVAEVERRFHVRLEQEPVLLA